MLYKFFIFSQSEKRTLLLLLFSACSLWGWVVCSDKKRQKETIEQSVTTHADSVVIQPEIDKLESASLETTLQPKSQIEPQTSVAIASTVIKSKEPDPQKHTQERKTNTSNSEEFRQSKSLYKKRSSYAKVTKLPKGSIVELNSADTLLLRQVPGIGVAYSNRIFKFRELLGGFVFVEQLSEVYGIDEERYNELKVWFKADTSLIVKLKINKASFKEINKHPYISYEQTKVICNLRDRKGRLESLSSLRLLDEFTADDLAILSYYLDFSE